MKILIDAGFNVGKYTSEHIAEFDKVYAFEPNPMFASISLKDDKLIWSNKAIWVNDGELTFYFCKRDDGGSVMEEKNNLTDNGVKVKCFNFSKWIMRTFSKHDYIELKMDIEGAEFPVLSKMINDYSIKWIDKILVEFHTKRLGGGDYIDMEKRIISDLTSMGVQYVRRR